MEEGNRTDRRNRMRRQNEDKKEELEGQGKRQDQKQIQTGQGHRGRDIRQTRINNEKKWEGDKMK